MSKMRKSLLAAVIAPRVKENNLFSLQLVKIEDGMMEGEVMFHQYITKTDEEVKAIR